jgi:hypothetical protein
MFDAVAAAGTVLSSILNPRLAGSWEFLILTAYLMRLETSSATTATTTPRAAAPSGTTSSATTRSASSASTVRDFLARLVLRLRGVVDKQVVQR